MNFNSIWFLAQRITKILFACFKLRWEKAWCLMCWTVLKAGLKIYFKKKNIWAPLSIKLEPEYMHFLGIEVTQIIVSVDISHQEVLFFRFAIFLKMRFFHIHQLLYIRYWAVSKCPQETTLVKVQHRHLPETILFCHINQITRRDLLVRHGIARKPIQE